MASMWKCEVCHHQFMFIPKLDSEGKPTRTRPAECPNCGVPDFGTDGEVTLDVCEG